MNRRAVLTAVRRANRRFRGWLSGGVALLLGCLGTGSRGAEAAEVSASTIKVLTYNIMWEENGVRAGNLALPVWEARRIPVIRLITAAAADVVGLQEASPEQQAGLRVGLPEFAFVYDPIANNTNPILFDRRRFRSRDSGVFVLNEKPEVEGTNIGVRRSTWVHLEELKSGRDLWVYNLHLDHRSKGPARDLSVVRLVERMARHGGTVVVTGDFNTPETSPAMRFFYGQTSLLNDAGEVVQNPRPLVNAYRSVHPDVPPRVIDHVLVGPGVGVRKAGLVKSGVASDHDIIWVEVSLP